MFQYDYTPAKLYDAGGDLSKRWYAYYSVRINGKLKLKKLKAGINRGKTVKERRRIGSIVVSELNALLEKDWRPASVREQDTAPAIPLKETLTNLLELKKSLRRRTWQSYEYSLNVLFEWLDKTNRTYIFPLQFTKQMAYQFTDYLQKDRNFTGKTFNSCKENISMFFNILEDRESILKNPFKKIKPLPEIPGRHIAFTDEEMKKIDAILKAKHYQLYIFTRFIYYCYIREIEILRLDISDINTKQWFISIYGDQAKSKVQSVVEIPSPLRKLIKEMKLEKYPSHFKVFSKALLPGPSPMSRNNVTRLFKVLVKDVLNLSDDHTMYAFKHTGNVKAKKLGIDIDAIRRQNRHTTEAQTRVYLRSIGQDPNVEFARKMK